MKLRAITLNNVRRFTTPVRIDSIADGLNVLCEANEHGKSTLFDAIQALFFAPHGSGGKEVKALRPHAGGAPEVGIEIETEDGRFLLAKRWLSKSFATVHSDGRLIAQASEAEAWIARLLGGSDAGPSGLLWVRQGVSGLADGGKAEQERAAEARRDLLSSVAGEVDSMTGGRRMDGALRRCRAELERYATPGGKPSSKGPWKAAQDEVDRLSALETAQSDLARDLHEALNLRRGKRAALAELEHPDAVAARKAQVEAAEQAFRDAEQYAGTVAALAQTVALARLEVGAAEQRLTALSDARRELDLAETDRLKAGQEVQRVRAALAEAEQMQRTALADRDAARIAATAALKVARDAQQRHLARLGADRRAALDAQIARAETARRDEERARAAAAQGLDAKALQKLEKLAGEVATARALRDGQAVQIEITYAAGRSTGVARDGRDLTDGTAEAIPEGATLHLEGLGTLAIRAGAAGRDDGSVATAERALAEALEAASVSDLAAAREAASARARATQTAAEARARFDALAPDGIAALHRALAAIPALDAVAEGPDPDTAEAERDAADARLREADRGLATRDAQVSDLRAALAHGEAERKGAEARCLRATDALSRLPETDATLLEAARVRAAQALRTAETRHRERAANAPDLAGAEATLRRVRSVEQGARDDIARLRPELARLEERIEQASGAAVEEQLAETRDRLTAAEAHLARIVFEVAVLRRLECALETARTEARERYFAPVVAELKPLLHLLWPDAELTWRDDTLLPDRLIRDGQEEPLDILSGGTQEQIALLVRLAFARMLARAGRHAPVILDDALVFSDDDRIERMFDALHRQAGDLQIIVLSCRQRAFRQLGGHRLVLEAVQP